MSLAVLRRTSIPSQYAASMDWKSVVQSEPGDFPAGSSARSSRELACSSSLRVHSARAFIGLARSSGSRVHRARAIIELARSSSLHVHRARAFIRLARSSSLRVHRACAFIEHARSSSLRVHRACLVAASARRFVLNAGWRNFSIRLVRFFVENVLHFFSTCVQLPTLSKEGHWRFTD